MGMSVRLPRLLDDNMRERRRLHPVSLRLEMCLMPLSTAMMVLPPGEEGVAAGDFVELYGPEESAGVFRVSCIETDYGPGGGQRVWLEHGLCTLSDELIVGEQLYHGLSGGALSSAFVSSAATLRAEASTASEALASLGAGTGVTILGESGTWYRVRWRETEGYLPASSVTRNKESGPFPLPGKITAASYAYLRPRPSTGYSAMARVPNGAAVMVVGAQGSWYMATWGEITGWVQKAYVALDGMTDAKAPVGSVVRELLRNHQSVQRWRIGTSQVDTALGFTFCNENLLEAVLRTAQSVSAPCRWGFDQTVYPWELQLLSLPDEVSCEMRLSRNMTGLRVTVDRSDMVTVLLPVGKDGVTIDGVNGGSTELVSPGAAVWGRVCRVYEDGREDDLQSLKAAAQSELKRRDAPVVSVEADALLLSQLTGQAVDRFTLGALCRVALPEAHVTLEERVIGLTWEDVLHEPERVRVTMANRLESAASLLAGMDSVRKIR